MAVARWKTISVLATIVIGMRSSLAAEPGKQGSAQNDEPTAFSVATFNINWGNPSLPRVAAVIRQAKADLVLLQETNAQSEVYLRRSMRGDYPNMYFRGDKGEYAAERFGIMAKFPVTGLKFLRPKEGLFGAWMGQTMLGGRMIEIANVHLQPILVESRQGIAGLLKAYSAMEQTHLREIENVYENRSPDMPLLVCGDFNSTSSFLAPRFLVGKGLVDSFASVTEKPDSHSTWHWFFGQTEVSLRIDYIFHTRHVRTLESRILESDASDHHLVVSRLQWTRDEIDGKKPRPKNETDGKADAES